MPQTLFTGQTTSKKAIILLLLTVLALLLWLVPALLGHASSYDWIIAAGWILLMGIAIAFIVKVDSRKNELIHTVYIDEDRNCGFNPCIGVFQCESKKDLVDKLIVMFANMTGESNSSPKHKAPADFSPSLIVETSAFKFRREEDAKASTPVENQDDVTVEDWSGRIVDARTGDHRSFRSLFELEESF